MIWSRSDLQDKERRADRYDEEQRTPAHRGQVPVRKEEDGERHPIPMWIGHAQENTVTASCAAKCGAPPPGKVWAAGAATVVTSGQIPPTAYSQFTGCRGWYQAINAHTGRS